MRIGIHDLIRKELARQIHIEAVKIDAEMMGVDLSKYSRDEIANLDFDDIKESALMNVENL